MTVKLRLQSVGDLLRRYTAAFTHAWQHRAQRMPIERLPHEAQFLPSALALQETPISPAPRVAMWLLMTFALLALLWAVLGRIDVVATAQGKVVPNDRTKIIQPFETATVQAIRVSDGQAVRAGDVLIELDATSAQADQDRLYGELATARLQIARGQAFLVAVDAGGSAQLARPEALTDDQSHRWTEPCNNWPCTRWVGW
jgi:hemolysin D